MQNWSGEVKLGDKVKLIGIPPIQDDDKLQTCKLFEKCLGKTFTVNRLQSAEGISYQLVQRDVGHVVGKASYIETIWVEPEFWKLKHLHKFKQTIC
jgi:hypothetical protein